MLVSVCGARNQNPWFPGQIRLQRLHNPLRGGEDFLRGASAVFLELEHDATARLEKMGGFGRDATDHVQPIAAAIQSGTGFEVAHFGVEFFYFAAWDIGRVGDNQVEFCLTRDRFE